MSAADHRFPPLLTLPTAAYSLGCSARHTLRLLSASRLRGVNIALAPQCSRREIRIYRNSVRTMNGSKPAPTDPVSVLPHHRPHLLKREIASILDCHPRHVTRLAAAGHLQSVSTNLNLGSQARIVRFDAAAFVAWLATREIQ